MICAHLVYRTPPMNPTTNSLTIVSLDQQS